jgi:hypothetical protein
MKQLRHVAAVGLMLGLGVTGAGAQTLYSNGPVNGTVDAWTINYGYSVANSFTLSGASTLTGADFGVWTFSGDTAETVDWSITTSPLGGTTLFSGTANLAQTFLFTNGFGYNVDLESFALGNLGLGAGTYYFELQNATVNTGDPLYWDENDGPSLAYESANGQIGSESFDIYGTATAVPEPTSLAALLIGLTAVGYVRRRRAI